MALTDIYNLIETEVTLRNRVVAAVWEAAVAIAREDPGTLNHANRLSWAQTVLSSVDATREEGQKCYLLVIQNATIQAAGNTATDIEIRYSVVADALPYRISPQG